MISGLRTYMSEAWSELKKVAWPTRQTVINLTLIVIAVSVDNDLTALQSFVAEEKPPWTVVADNHPKNQKSMAARFGIRGIPAFILVGRDGKVVTVHCRGERLGQSLARLVNHRVERTSSIEVSAIR